MKEAEPLTPSLFVTSNNRSSVACSKPSPLEARTEQLKNRHDNLTRRPHLTMIGAFMKLRSVVTLLILVLASGLTACKEVGDSRPGLAGSAPAAGSAPRHVDNDCLSCHGPFDQLIASSAKYVAPSGEKTSPHRYIPHASKLAKDIPDCIHCHTAHPLSPLPSAGQIDLSKVSVEWCYTCHHEKNFKSCKECHP